ncbi:hypothetical protein [Pantoea ananatis]|nr:hypothetical protein [Pantoea ananatis]
MMTPDYDREASLEHCRIWCIREDDSADASPFGSLLKQRYPPWRSL